MSRLIPVLSVLSAWGALAVITLIAMATNGGVFEYPLDDVYIHLAMSEQIAAGGYGVNAGEVASAASSPLYPFLLLFSVGTTTQSWLPLVWNIIGLTLSAWFWGRILVRSGYASHHMQIVGILAALFGPIALNMFGIAFTGMEHSLHTAASLAIVLGLLRLIQDEEMNLLILIGAFFATAMRLEGLALGLMAAFVVMRQVGAKPAILTALLAVIPAVAFVGGLVSLGLDPLPASVQAKLGGNSGEELSFINRIAIGFRVNIAKPGGFMLLLACLGMLSLVMAAPRLREQGPRALGIAILMAGLAHLMFGQIGWMERYEGYIWATLAAGLVALSADEHGETALPSVMTIGVLLVGITTYFTPWSVHFPWGMRAIYMQPAQSARFAKDFAQVPVAVNDLGIVSWANPNYVLDLWGLASTEARHLRLGNPEQGWAEPLTQQHGVQLAMIYDAWLSEAVGADWVKLGELRLDIAKGYLGSDRVSYYATSPEYVDHLTGALQQWAPTLPDGAFFVYAEVGQ